MAANTQQTRDRVMAHARSPERLLARLDERKAVDEHGCWVSTRGVRELGYATMQVGDRKRPEVFRVEARAVAAQVIQLQPVRNWPDMQLVGDAVDEPVTRAENMRRSQHRNFVTRETGVCQRGHGMADAYVHPTRGDRACRQCRDLAYQRRKAKRRESSRARREQERRTD